MDRRRLLVTAAALAPGALGLTGAARALAQTQLPPARPIPQDGPPPSSDDYPQDRPPPPPPGRYPPDGQPMPAYHDPSQPPSASRDPAYRDPAARDPAYRDDGGPLPPNNQPSYPASTHAETYSREELVNSVSDFLGVTAEAAGSAVERVFRDNGRPTGYIAGEEASGAFIGGLRYGKGLLYMKNRQPVTVYWQGPTVGFDWGGNASRAFTLCYNLQYPDALFRRFPGVEGSAYLIGGLGVNYQRAEDIVLAPIRAGIGLRLGANIGYLSYSRRRNWIPL